IVGDVNCSAGNQGIANGQRGVYAQIHNLSATSTGAGVSPQNRVSQAGSADAASVSCPARHRPARRSRVAAEGDVDQAGTADTTSGVVVHRPARHSRVAAEGDVDQAGTADTSKA